MLKQFEFLSFHAIEKAIPVTQQSEDGMITTEDFRSVMPAAEPLFDRLQGLYGRLPETRCTCEKPGMCCMYLPEITVIEALQWIRFMQTMPDLELTSTHRKFVEFYLTNPARFTGCPFLADGSCSVYECRTFGCRSYGLWSQKMGNTRTRESRNGKKALRLMWKKFGVELPADVVEFEIDYCDKVQVVGDKSFPDKTIMALLKQVYDLGKPLGNFQARFETQYYSDFSFLLTSLVFGMKESLVEKFAVIKEIAEKGTETRLQEALAKVTPDTLRL